MEHTDGVPRRSPLLWVGAFVVLLVVGIAAGVAGVPPVPLTMVLSGVGAALVVRAWSDRQLQRADAVAPGALDDVVVRFSALRWSVGSPWQLRFSRRNRAVGASGVIGIAPGEVRFVPSSARRAPRAWSGRPTAVEVLSVLQATVLRVHAPEGTAQFSIQVPASVVRDHLAPLLPLTGS